MIVRMYDVILSQQQAIADATLAINRRSMEDGQRGTWGGRPRGAKNYRRGKSTWIRDYVGTNNNPPIYPSETFRRRFAIPRTLYRKLKSDLLQYRPNYWCTRMIAARRPGHPTDVKILACLRMLSTGGSTDTIDDACGMAEETTRQYCKSFCRDIVDMYGSTYLKRWPTEAELDEIQRRYVAKGFPGCVGALDCSKLFWKNCPAQDKGQYLNTKESTKLASIQCEAWCDADLYCWHLNVGRPGTNNDINVLTRSRLLKDIMSGRFQMRLDTAFKIIPGGQERRLLYFLVDSIYPDWPIFSKPIKDSDDPRERRFSRMQESARKDIERFFGVLQSRFEILRREFRKWEIDDIISIAEACVILHNLIVRMQMNGDFRDESQGGDLITEIYNNDVQLASQSAINYEEQRIRIRDEVLADWQEQVTRMLINDVQYTSFDDFVQLEAELIEYVNSNFGDGAET